MTEQEMREAFEKWESNDGKFPRAVERTLGGDYKLLATANAWRVWQEATRQAEEKAQRIRDCDLAFNALAIKERDYERAQALSAEAREQAAWTAGIQAGIEIGRNNQRIDAAKAAEPVVWRWKWPGYQWVYEEHRPDEQGGKIVEPLYTPPPRAQANPSDADIEEIAQANGIRKSDEHWGYRYYTELGSDLFRFARAVLARYGSAQADADKRDAERWRYISKKLCLSGNGDGTCSMHAINLPNSIPGWPRRGEADEFCGDAIDDEIAKKGGAA